MKLLFLVHRIPYPPNKGDKIRSWNELKYLAERHEVHLGCLVDQPEDMKYVEDLRPHVASLGAFPLNTKWAKLRSLSAIIAGGALSTRYFQSRALQEYVDTTVAQHSPDAILLFSSPMADYVIKANLPMVMDFCDVDSDKWRQYAENAAPGLRHLYALEAERLAIYEREVLETCSSALLVTQQEKDLWQELPSSLLDKVHVIPNGVDLEFFAADAVKAPPPRRPHAMAFTGAMDYYANVDAVCYFVHDVLPRIQAQLPDASFTIVGSRPTAEVLALADKPGVKVTGFVDDIRGYYLEASLSVIPLRIARGIQNKVLEAMSMGRPVLASQPAFEGLGAEPGKEIEVARTAEELAQCAIELLQNPVRAEELGSLGRKFVEREYVWEKSMQAMERLLLEAKTSAEAGKQGLLQPV